MQVVLFSLVHIRFDVHLFVALQIRLAHVFLVQAEMNLYVLQLHDGLLKRLELLREDRLLALYLQQVGLGV